MFYCHILFHNKKFVSPNCGGLVENRLTLRLVGPYSSFHADVLISSSMCDKAPGVSGGG